MRKDELHRHLWPDAFVSDAALVSLVKELRRSLGDRGALEPIVRTSHGVGYAFGAALNTAARDPAASAVTAGVSGAEHWIVTAERRIALGEGDNIIGRMPEAIVSLDIAGVSRRHALIVVHGHQAEIEDLGSKNGTIVRDQRLTARTDLRDGDRIRLGPITVTYAFTERNRSTDTMLIS